MKKSVTYPPSLFKYVLSDRVDILENLMIRFTQPSALNDRFELQPIFGDLMEDGLFDEVVNPSSPDLREALIKQYKNQSRRVRRKFTLVQYLEATLKNPAALQDAANKERPSFERSMELAKPGIKEMLRQKMKTLGILSLSDNPVNDMMWAHYADNGKGFIYEFDTSHTYFNRRRSSTDELFHLRKVFYLNRDPEGRTLMNLEGDDLLCTKAKVWEHESEWRILAPLKQTNKKIIKNGDDIYLFEIPAIVIKRIIFGTQMNSSIEEKIRKIVKGKDDLSHVRLARIQINLEFNCLDIVPAD